MTERLKETPQLVDVELVSAGWINKYVLRYRLPDDTAYEYESVSRKKPDAYRAELERLGQGEPPLPDAVCIVPVLPDGSLLLIREFRYPLNSWCIAFPAGLMEPGEDLECCVERELREETGYRLCMAGAAGANANDAAGAGADASGAAPEKAIAPLPQSGFSSTGLAEENVQVVFARVEPSGSAAPELGEFIEPFVVAPDDIAAFLATNRTPIGTRCQLVLELLACVNPLALFV